MQPENMGKNELTQIPGMRQSAQKSQLIPGMPWTGWCQGLCWRRQSSCSIGCCCLSGCRGGPEHPEVPVYQEGWRDAVRAASRTQSNQPGFIFCFIGHFTLRHAHSPVHPALSGSPPQTSYAEPMVSWCPHRSGLASQPSQTSPTQTHTSGGWRTCSASMPMCLSMASGL